MNDDRVVQNRHSLRHCGIPQEDGGRRAASVERLPTLTKMKKKKISALLCKIIFKLF